MSFSAKRSVELAKDVRSQIHAHLLWGDALVELGDFDQALAVADRAIKIEAHSGLAIRAGALARLGRFDEALRASELACEISPHWSRGHFARADILIDLGRLDDAVTAIQLTCDLEPGFTQSDAFRKLLLRIGESKAPGYSDNKNMGDLAAYYAVAAAGDFRPTYILCPEPPSNYRVIQVIPPAGDTPKDQSIRAPRHVSLVG